MATVQQQIAATVQRKIAEKVNPAAVRAALNYAGNRSIDRMRSRTNSGVDVNYKAFPNYTPKYQKDKAKMIATGKRGKKTLKKGKFAARKVRDVGRLTGQTMEDMQCTVTSAKVDKGFPEGEVKFRFRTKRSENVAVGNAKAGYVWYFMAKGNSSGARNERDAFKKDFLTKLGIGKVGVSVNEV